MLHRLYLHVVWTTRDRRALIDAGLASYLCRFFRGIAGQERAHVLEVGMVATHVHMLVRVHPTTDLTRLLQRLKGGSSMLANRERRAAAGLELKWAKGYSIRSVSQRALPAVREYLRSQPQHHRTEAIAGWKGDAAEYEVNRQDEWFGPGRNRTA